MRLVVTDEESVAGKGEEDPPLTSVGVFLTPVRDSEGEGETDRDRDCVRVIEEEGVGVEDLEEETVALGQTEPVIEPNPLLDTVGEGVLVDSTEPVLETEGEVEGEGLTVAAQGVPVPLPPSPADCEGEEEDERLPFPPPPPPLLFVAAVVLVGGKE